MESDNCYSKGDPEFRDGSGNGSLNYDKIIKVTSAAMGVSYALWACRNLLSLLGTVPSLFWRPASALLDIAGLIFIIAPAAFMAAGLLLLAFKRTEENTEKLFLSVAVGAAALSIGKFIWMILKYMSRMLRGSRLLYSVPFSSTVVTAFTAVCAAGIIFALFYVSGRKLLIGRPKEQIINMAKDVPEYMKAAMKQEMPSAEGYRSDQAHGGVYVNRGERIHDPVMMKTGRSFILYMILNLCTCSLYGWYFYGKMAKNLNLMCEGDNETTVGLPVVLLLSICTLGFYMYYWHYKFAERLFKNAGAFGADVKEDGTMILILNIAGLFTCGLAQLAAMYIQIKNLNALSEAYNRTYFDVG